jgi:AraC-like DNA-binding protein
VVFQGFFVFAILLLNKKGNKTANIILAILVLLLTFYLLDNLLGMLNFFETNAHFLHLVTPLWYLFPPLCYFYVKKQMNPEFKWKQEYFFHFIPFLLMLYRFFPFYFLPAEIKLQFFTDELKPPGTQLMSILFVLISPIQLALYSGIIRFKTLKEKPTSNFNPVHLNWLKLFFTIFFLFGLMQTVLITKWIFTQEITLQFKYVPLALFAFIIYSIAYLAIIQPEALFPFKILKLKKINGEQTRRYATELINLVEDEKLYLNSELKYSEVASRLGISARYLTEVLSRELGKSFSDFVNEYRVKEVQQRIQNNETKDLTLYAIALDSGFNSKSSFNRVFKKHTGCTPSEFVTQISFAQSQKVS